MTDDLEWKDAPRIAGMKPWACSFDGKDGRYGITLYGTDMQQVLDDNGADLPGLSVDGELAMTARIK